MGANLSAFGQSILPDPIRLAGASEPMAESIVVDEPGDLGGIPFPNQIAYDDQTPWNSLRAPADHSYQVLRAPPPSRTGHGKSHSTSQRSPTAESESKWLVHPPYSPHRRRIQPTPPTLPGANQRAIWKTPYSYGYFGASGTRHWSLHHGYRGRYTDWRLQ